MSRWEQLFLEDKRVHTTPHSRAAERAAEIFLHAGKQPVLDLACGVGRDSSYLAGHGVPVIGLDAAGSGVLWAEATRQEQGLPACFLQGDARHLPFADRSFGGVFCFGLLHEFVGPDWEVSVQAVMDEILRVLREDGLVVLTVLAGDPAAGLPHVHLFSKAEFAAAVAGFSLLEQDLYDDRGCTGREDYRIWYAVLERTK